MMLVDVAHLWLMLLTSMDQQRVRVRFNQTPSLQIFVFSISVPSSVHHLTEFRFHESLLDWGL